MTERRRMMDAVYTAGFAADEARLYLDTHPDCEKALDYYNQKTAEYNHAVGAYEARFGPIRPQSGGMGGHWGWATEPWPWEGGM
jgi:spore coat protein JB